MYNQRVRNIPKLENVPQSWRIKTRLFPADFLFLACLEPPCRIKRGAFLTPILFYFPLRLDSRLRGNDR
jgi:hypothetical protein